MSNNYQKHQTRFLQLPLVSFPFYRGYKDKKVNLIDKSQETMTDGQTGEVEGNEFVDRVTSQIKYDEGKHATR